MLLANRGTVVARLPLNVTLIPVTLGNMEANRMN